MSPFERLAVPHVRAVRKLARLFEESPQGALAFAIGRGERVRAAALAALQSALGDAAELREVVLDEAEETPWKRLVDAARSGGERAVIVVARLVFADVVRERAMLNTLNLGRETRVSERVRLLVWIDGFDAAERVRKDAQDLWSYRAGVYLFLSREDFETGELEAPPGGYEDLAARVEELRRRFAASLSLRGWVAEGLEFARLLVQAARFEEAFNVLNVLRMQSQQFDSSSNGLNLMLRSNRLLFETGQASALFRYASEIETAARHDDKPTVLHVAMTARVDAASQLEQWEVALNAAAEAVSLPSRFRPWDPLLRVGHAPALLSRGWLRLALGDLIGAEADAHLASDVPYSAEKDDSWPVLRAADVDLLQATVTLRRARPLEALALAHNSLTRRAESRLANLVRECVTDVVPWFAALGLLDDAAELAERARPLSDHTADALLSAQVDALIADTFSAARPLLAARHYDAAIDSATRYLSVTTDPFLRIETLLTRALWQRRRHSLDRSSSLDRALAELDEAQSIGLEHDAVDHLQRIEESRGECLLLAKRHDDARAAFERAITRCQQSYGASRIATLQRAIARVETDRNRHAPALDALDAASLALSTEEVIPRRARQALAVARHDALAALGRRAEARAEFEGALRLALDAGDQLDAMSLHLALADDDSYEHSEQVRHARASMRIAEAALRPLDEARARLRIVELNPRTDAASTARLREAWWIIDELGDAPTRERVAKLATNLGVTPEHLRGAR